MYSKSIFHHTEARRTRGKEHQEFGLRSYAFSVPCSTTHHPNHISSCRFLSNPVQCLIKVGDDVVRVFRPDAEADHVGGDIGQGAGLASLLLMG